MSHNHSHEDNHGFKKLLVIIVLTFVYMLAEFFGGLYTKSLALLADSGHMLSDFAALVLSLFAMWLAKKPPSHERTYGYYRTEILAAFINGIVLVVIALFIIYDAALRFVNPPEVKAPVMLIIAFGGLLINLFAIMLLHKTCQHNLNVKGAFLHIVSDFLGSAGTLAAGFIILFTKFYQADSIISCFIAVLILQSAIRLVIEAANILLEAAPSHINVKEIEEALLCLDEIKDIHDFHVWSITPQKISLSVHVVSDSQQPYKLLQVIDCMLNDKFGISHASIQIEPPNFHVNGCSFIKGHHNNR